MSNIHKLAGMLSDSKHAALITGDVSRRYLSGFKSSAGIILVTKEQSYLLIDFRYFDKAKEKVTDLEVILLENTRSQLMELMLKHGISRISVENDIMTLSQYESFRRDFAFAEFDNSDMLSSAIADMRIIKTNEEVEKIIKAQRIAEKAYTRLLGDLHAGMSEKHVAALLDYYMMQHGSDGLSFDTIAASGVNSASPHAVPTNKKLEEGDFLTLDFGATYDGYHSDMTRTVAIGYATPEMENVYKAVYSANLDALKSARAGVSARLLDSVARSTLNAWGYEKYFGHGLGHGVGLEIHEAPTASQRSTHNLKAGMIVTIEPGVYLSGKFGVRIEDMALITEDGCVDLTHMNKGFVIIK